MKFYCELLYIALLCAVFGSYSASVKAGDNLVVGVGTHLAGGKRDIVPSLDLLQAAGVESIRDDATWALVEQAKGELKIPVHWDVVVNEAHKRGIEVLWILDYGNRFYGGGAKPNSDEGRAAFARYASFIVEHFKGRVRRYEIWNEWEHTTGRARPGSPDDYVKLVDVVLPAIKGIDPAAEVIVGAVGSEGIRSGYLRRIIELGALEHADALSLHPYVHCRRWGSSPRAWAEWMRSLHHDLNRWVGKPVEVYVTEMGWPSNQGTCGISEQKQAQYLKKMFDLVRDMPFIKGIWWYDFQNDGLDRKNRQHNFGLVDEKFDPKPAYQELKRMGQ